MKQVQNVLILFFLAAFVITANSQTLFTATLTGNQLTPPVVSSGRGTAWAVLSADMKTLTYRLTFARLSSAPAGGHFHIEGNGVEVEVLPLTFTSNTASGTWTDIPDSVVRYLLKNQILLNVHSSALPGGEIGGFLHPVSGVGFTIAMSGTQEDPPNGSAGLGTGFAVLDSAGARISYDVTVAGLTDTLRSGHFHAATSGSVLRPMTFVDSTASGTWAGFADSVLTGLLHTGLYVNVHTKTFPGGELRGTVTPVGPMTFTATITGDQESPAVITSARGTIWGILGTDMKTLTYRLTYARLSSARTGAHFHLGGTGNGAVANALSFAGNTAAGTWSNMTDDAVRHLFRSEVYVNIHSGTNPGGEIRGVLRLASGIGFTAALDGAHETPANGSTGLGTAFVVLDSTGTHISYDLTVAGLTDTLRSGHFHATSTGGVLKPIAFVDSTASGTWTGFGDSILTALGRGGVYLNVHSKAFPGGELRGTVTGTFVQTTDVAAITPDHPTSFRLEQNYPNPFNPSTVVSFQLTVAGNVRLTVYDVLGREVATLLDGFSTAGAHTVTWNAAGRASGVYFYRLTTGRGESALGKMILLK
jgi:hypothetical protein